MCFWFSGAMPMPLSRTAKRSVTACSVCATTLTRTITSPRAGDVIVSIDGNAVTSTSDIASALATHHPGNHVQVRRRGGQAVPLFSPRADCLFDQHRSFAAIIAELRARNIRFITLVEGSPINDDFNRHYRFLRELRQDKFKVITIANLITIYDVEMIAALLQPTPAVSGGPR